MEITILCRLNQARSPFAQSVLEHFFPEHSFYSAGISAVQDAETSEGARAIAEAWKLPLMKLKSEHISIKKTEILNSDCVILSESTMVDYLSDLGFLGKSAPFDELKIESSFIPRDPLGFSLDRLRVELAKVAYCCVQIMRNNYDANNQNLLSVVIPESEEDTAYAYSYAAFEQRVNGGVIIDADFRAPTAKHYSVGFNILFVDLTNLETIDFSKIRSNTVITPTREYANPESILLSRAWRAFLKKGSSTMPIYLISAPKRTEEKSIADSYLCSLWADKVTIINS